MATIDDNSSPVEYEWHYTPEILEETYDRIQREMEAGTASKEDAWFAVCAGYALDLIEYARAMPENGKSLNLDPLEHPDDMMPVLAFASAALQPEGPNAMREKLAKMLASYEFFNTMNFLLSLEVDFDYQIDESGIVMRATTPEGDAHMFNFLNRAKFNMSRCVFSEPGEDLVAAITAHPFYSKLREGFVIPLIPKEGEDQG